MMTSAALSGMTRVNDAEIYYEVRGSGPTVLLIHGSAVDSGCYDGLAEILAREFTVVRYDRRGYSRSPRPPGWTTTSIEEQAADADALLAAVGIVPAAVFGSSTGALIALELVIRHPDHLRGAVLHEPTIFGVLPPAYVQEQFSGVTPLIEEAMVAGGPRAAQRTLLALLAGEGGFEGLATDEIRERWLKNADLVFGMEFPNILLAYLPTSAAIASIPVPIEVLRAESTLPINIAADEWLAARTGTTLLECPGAHLAYINRPGEVAATLRPFLTRVSQ